MQPAKRVVLNTGFLYAKMLITMFISLFSTRLVLNALGVNDYGIFNLMGGVIGMLSFLNGAMAVATQRYMSYSLGGGDTQRLKSVFNSSVILHLGIGFLVVLLLEIGGLFIFNGFLNIPPARLWVAKIVFHLMVVSTFFTINSVPYDAAINSHENMLFDSLSGIFESVSKLGIAFWLIYYKSDRLILYGILIAALTIFIRIVKSTYCLKMYDECRLRLREEFNVTVIKEMFSFAGWNLFGAFCSVVRNQGMAVLLNLFNGIVINAAYGIANQVNGQLSAFSVNLVKALTPQIFKSEGSGDRSRMLRLATLACKLSFFLLSFLAIPIIIEMPYILHIWLKKVPDYTIIFCQLILVISLIQQITVGLMHAVQSVGKIKVYQTVMGTLLILNLPFAYFLLKAGFPVHYVLVSAIFLECVAGLSRVWFTSRLAGLLGREFLKKTILVSFISAIMAFFIAYTPHFVMHESFSRLILTGLISTLSLLFLIKKTSLTNEEYLKIKSVMVAFVQKKLKK